jgi:hypothetical protein
MNMKAMGLYQIKLDIIPSIHENMDMNKNTKYAKRQLNYIYNMEKI